MRKITWTLAAALLPAGALHAQQPADCNAIESAVERLACHDTRAGRKAQLPPSSMLAPTRSTGTASPLGERWAIGTRDSLFDVRPHEPSYILPARISDNVNQRPGTGTRPQGPVDLGLEDIEAKFQLSFKFRLAQFDSPWLPNVWAGYTQQSQWQVYNKERSAFFRNTDHAPEVMLAWHPDVDVGPLRLRLVNIGFLHQSNGRSEVLSRSWNRVYAQFGLERGGFVMLVRPWVRVEESDLTGDNQDIRDYMGHGDVVLSYRMGGHVLSAKGRHNFSTGNGYAEASWSFPLARRIRGHVQLTSGYGESLLDYNWRQNTAGVGIALFDWQ